MDYSEQIRKLIDPSTDDLFLMAFSIITGEKLTYNFPSLVKLERAINNVYKLGHKPVPSTLVSTGLYLGETIRRNIGGEWLPEAPDIWDLILKHPTKGNIDSFVKPMLRAHRFWEDRTQTLTGLYKNAEFQLNYDITDKEAMDKLRDEDGWITLSDGYQLRYTQQPTDDDQMNKFLNK